MVSYIVCMAKIDCGFKNFSTGAINTDRTVSFDMSKNWVIVFTYSITTEYLADLGAFSELYFTAFVLDMCR